MLQLTALLTIKSDNRKTGPIPVSMTEKASCPPNCRTRKTCYAQGGGLGITWCRMSYGKLKSALSWERFCQAVQALPATVKIWRCNQAGDLPGLEGKLDREACLALAEANRAGGYSRGGFTYTHYTPIPGQGISVETAEHNREVIAEMNRRGFTVNLSADNQAHADQLAALEIGPVVVVLPKEANKGSRTPEGRAVTLCPAARSGHATTCQDCHLCRKVGRKVIVGFPAHGMAKNQMSALAEGNAAF